MALALSLKFNAMPVGSCIRYAGDAQLRQIGQSTRSIRFCYLQRTIPCFLLFYWFSLVIIHMLITSSSLLSVILISLIDTYILVLHHGATFLHYIFHLATTGLQAKPISYCCLRAVMETLLLWSECIIHKLNSAKCVIGHAICSVCHGMLLNKDKCHVYSITGGYNRCIVVEQILESVQAACSNTKYGCAIKTHYHKHQTNVSIKLVPMSYDWSRSPVYTCRACNFDCHCIYLYYVTK